MGDMMETRLIVINPEHVTS